MKLLHNKTSRNIFLLYSLFEFPREKIIAKGLLYEYKMLRQVETVSKGQLCKIGNIAVRIQKAPHVASKHGLFDVFRPFSFCSRIALIPYTTHRIIAFIIQKNPQSLVWSHNLHTAFLKSL